MDGWQGVAGAADAEWTALINKPNITNSNAFLIRTSEELIVVDPGADEAQIERLNALIAEGLGRRRRVLVILTHCHYDHASGLDRLRIPRGVELHYGVGATGAEAIEAGDRLLTASYINPTACLPTLRFGARFFGTDPLPFPATTDRLDLGEGIALPRVTIPLVGGLPLEVLHTPGHTACSLSLRLGGLLLVGDLPAAATPGLAGLAGWDQEALLNSLAGVSRLIEREGIQICGSGHGNLVAGDAMRSALLAAARTAEGLCGIADMDDARIRSLKAFAIDLLEESGTLFAAMAGRIYALHHHLIALDEAEAAEAVLGSLDSDAIDRALTDLHGFCGRFRDGHDPDLTIVLKAAATLRKVESAFRGRSADDALSGGLARRAESLLNHFLAAASGLSFPATLVPADLRDLIAEAVREVRAIDQMDAEQAFAAADDPEAFRRFLVRRLASTGRPPGTGTEIEIAGTARAALVDRERFLDATTTILDGLVRGGREALGIHLADDGADVVVRISGRPAILASDIPGHRIALLGRLLGEGRGVSIASGEVTIRAPAASAGSGECA